MNVLIVGAGLAGTCFARECMTRGLDFILVDTPLPGHASLSALGILNPMVPGRWNPVEQLAFFRPRADQVYGDSLAPIELLFHIGDKDKHDAWIARRETVEWLGPSAVCGPMYGHGRSGQTAEPEFWGRINGAARLDPAAWLDGQHRRFGDSLVRGTVDWGDSDPMSGGVKIRPAAPGYTGSNQSGGQQATALNDLRFDRIVCAEGWRVTENPFWQGLSWKPARGDSILVAGSSLLHKRFDATLDLFHSLSTQTGSQFEHWSGDSPRQHTGMQTVLCAGIHLLREPTGDFRIGSTFDWDYGFHGPDPRSAAKLVAQAASLLGMDPSGFTLAEHSWGIRPASAHRLPVIGLHPQNERLAILNGMGTRGVLYAPKAAQILAAQMFENAMPELLFLPRF